MLKPRGPICNLRCQYCYYRPKEWLYVGSDFRMSDAVLETFTRQYMAAQRAPEVIFAWQGGEPLLMGLDFYQRALALQERYRRPGQRVVNALQTNATLLDGAWASFFREHGFLVGVSLDGPAALHDIYRRDTAGHPTFARVIAGLAHLQHAGVEYNILSAVHAGNADRPLEVYRFLRDGLGARHLQFIPIAQVAPGPAPRWALSGRQWGRFLIAVFDEWVRRDVGQVFVQLFEAALSAWAGQGAGLCVHEPTCGTALALEHNGDLYACDHFVEPAQRRGNILETPLTELVGSEAQTCFGQAKRDSLPAACLECDVRFVCEGGCPKDRRASAAGRNLLCAGYRAFFHHIAAPMHWMAEAWRAGRAPAGIMRVLAQQDLVGATTGRG